MRIALRPWSIPADFSRIAEISTPAGWAPLQASTLAAAERPQPEGALRLRLVAEDETGAVQGFGWVYREAHEPPGFFELKVAVHPDATNQRIGTSLLNALEAFAIQNQGTHFLAKMRDDHPEWLAYAQRHGYIPERRHLGSKLDLVAFDDTPFHQVIPKLESQGIRFLSMAEPHTPALEHSLWELERDANHDEPGFEDWPFAPFEEWRRDTLENPNRPLDMLIVAADGDRAVGLAFARPIGDQGLMGTNFTGVHRAYRGRGIALAVKLLQIRAAKARGGTWMLTGSDSQNAPMLAVNRKLGYIPMPGMYRLFKRLPR